MFSGTAKGLYLLCADTHGDAVGLVMTVDDNKKRFQRREVAKAEEARELMRKLGYPSEKDMFQMVKSGALLNSPVTAQDIRNARAIFGADEASLKGKKKRKPSVIVDSKLLTTHEMPRQKLSILIMR